ncbi:MAG: hypothetical protein QME81_15690 [bacterium]|nr:hypothetical protein [bacterium]
MSTRPSYAKRLKAVSKVSEAIVSNLYLEDILRLITTVTAEVMGSRICSLMLLTNHMVLLWLRFAVYLLYNVRNTVLLNAYGLFALCSSIC